MNTPSSFFSRGAMLVAFLLIVSCAEKPPQPPTRAETLEKDLHGIQLAKSWWAFENQKTNTDVPTAGDLDRYFPKGLPAPPVPGKYVINAVGKEAELEADDPALNHTTQFSAVTNTPPESTPDQQK
jgi:hypothetical protein